MRRPAGSRSPRVALLATLLALVAGACGGSAAPTPVPGTPGASGAPSASTGPSASASARPVGSPGAVTGRVTDAQGRVSVELPEGWRALTPEDPAFEDWFVPDVAESLRNGLLSIAAVDLEGSTPERATYLLVAPIDLAETGYVAAAARAIVDGAVAASASTIVSRVELDAGSARRITITGQAPGEGDGLALHRVVHVVASGTPQIVLYQSLGGTSGASDAEADAIAATLEVAEPGAALDVPAHTCAETVPLADAIRSTATLPDLGQDHVAAGEEVAYGHCPPTSGTHYSTTLAPRFHGPTEPTVPQEWVHNLEHGQIVLLYRCGSGCTGDAQVLGIIARDAPTTPLCGQGLVVTRYDELPAPFALAAWGRLRYFDAIEAADVEAFVDAHGDAGPERMCAAPSPGASAAP